MKCYIGVGSNLKDRALALESAASRIQKISSGKEIKVSSVYESPALTPKGAPAEWKEFPYLNAVIQMEWQKTPFELFTQLKKIEVDMGRMDSPRWSPRIIDLDLLLFGDEAFKNDQLQIPHQEIQNRAFVLDPLKDLSSTLKIPSKSSKSSNSSKAIEAVSVLARKHPLHCPLIMGIINLTPDSFSDGGENNNEDNLISKITRMLNLTIPIIDLGAESTRPGAKLITEEEEWRRLEPALQFLRDNLKNRFFKPIISVDTYKPRIAERALVLGASMINDVSGMSDPNMLGLIKESRCDFVFMHNLSIPADPNHCWSTDMDPVIELQKWIEGKFDLFEKEGLELDRAIFDPGIGFGKTATQSITLLRRWDEFSSMPIRTLVGHSRKSFMKSWGISLDPKSREASTLGVSLALKQKGIDILRVHDFESHKLAIHALQEISQ